MPETDGRPYILVTADGQCPFCGTQASYDDVLAPQNGIVSQKRQPPKCRCRPLMPLR